ncbi:MAG: MFS transporter [Planctomycetes bacterium]|nr:MFS transporter [Planctomycetota bacterium]
MPPSTRQPSNGAILLVLFLDLVGFSIVFPMFAKLLEFYGQESGGLLSSLDGWLDATFGVDDPRRHAALFGGMLAGLYSIIQFVVTPFWGRLSDRIGRRPVLLMTVTMNLSGYVVWMFSGSFEVFLVSRVVCALASGNISVASAAVADLSSEENRSRAMGMMGAAIGLGFIIGPALGGLYAFDWVPKPTPGAAWSLNPFSVPAAAAAALSVLNLIWLARRFGETLPSEKRARGGATRTANPLRLFRSDLGPDIPTLNLAYLLFMLGFAGFEATLVFLLSDQLGYGPGWSAACMVWLGLCSAFVQGGLVRRMVKRTGERALALRGMVILIPAYALCAAVGLGWGAWSLWLGLSLLAVGVGFLSPTLSAMVSLRTVGATQGLAMGSYRSVGALGRAGGPLLAAFLYFGIGAEAPYLAAAALAIVPLLLLARVPAQTD